MTGFFTTISGDVYHGNASEMDGLRDGISELNFNQRNGHQSYRNTADNRSNYSHNRDDRDDHRNENGMAQNFSNYLEIYQRSQYDQSFNERRRENSNNYYQDNRSSEFSGVRRNRSPVYAKSVSTSMTSSRIDISCDVNTGLEDVEPSNNVIPMYNSRRKETNAETSTTRNNYGYREPSQLQQQQHRVPLREAAGASKSYNNHGYRGHLQQRQSPPSTSMNVKDFKNAGYSGRSSAFEPTRARQPQRLTDYEPPKVLVRPFNGGGPNGGGRNGGGGNGGFRDSGRQPYNSDGRANDDQRRPGGRRKEKFMPLDKTEFELYDPSELIQRGSLFDELFSTENDDRVQVTGAGNYPPRIQTFEECDFSPEIMKNLQLMNYSIPTQIQKFVMPLILKKKGDVVGHANTGSGKTVAFLAPVVHKIQKFKQERPSEPQRYDAPYAPYVIVTAPSRELCQQLYNDARRLALKTGVSTHLSMGDMPMSSSMASLRAGCDIFVATVGRTEHYIRDNIITLKNVQFFIMDEVDSLLCKEKEQFDKIEMFKTHPEMNPGHRTLMFSATLSSESQSALATFINEKSYFVYVGEMNRVVETVRQDFIEVTKARKRECLVDLLIHESKKESLPNGNYFYKPPKTIVFVAEKRMSDRTALLLATKGFQVISLNADRTLKQRITAIEKFSKGIYDVLVATDVSSRGMNFPQVEHVINYDLPVYHPERKNQELTYVHRLGRAGRAGNQGRATSFFDEKVDHHYIEFYISALTLARQPVPEFLNAVYKSHCSTGFKFHNNRPVNRSDLSDRAWM